MHLSEARAAPADRVRGVVMPFGRYPFVFPRCLSVLAALVTLLAMVAYSPLARAAALYGADFSLALGLIAGAFIDAEQMFLPDRITLGGAALAFATKLSSTYCS